MKKWILVLHLISFQSFGEEVVAVAAEEIIPSEEIVATEEDKAAAEAWVNSVLADFAAEDAREAKRARVRSCYVAQLEDSLSERPECTAVLQEIGLLDEEE